jgi:DNA-binding MarR family transcriptional regulator
MVSELQNKGLHINAAALPILGKMVLNGGHVQQGALVELLEVDRHRVSRMVKELQEADIVAVEQNPENKRENFLVFTEHGKSVMRVIDETAVDITELAFKEISKEAREITEQTLRQITNNLNPENYEVG